MPDITASDLADLIGLIEGRRSGRVVTIITMYGKPIVIRYGRKAVALL